MLYAQSSTGMISGTIRDASDSVISGATVIITNKATGNARNLSTNSDGLFSAPALAAGLYEVSAEAAGFRTVVRDAQVLAGTTTTVNLTMRLGETREVVTVEAATAQINYDSHAVQGSIERQSIQDLPLNGRNFMQLASIQPGVTVAPQVMASKNAPIQISILGAPSQSTLLTVDGMTIMDEVDSAAGTAMNFSQEVVQEFQVSSANFDLGTGITSGGAVNIVTRSGSADFHGSAYFFYRDRDLAAYPALKRSAVNPNPYFVRRNPGFWVSGPLVKDKLFFFFNYEDENQVQAVTVQPDLASIADLAGIFSSPQIYKSLTARFDYRLSANTSLFARYTHDGNHIFGAVTGTPFPSTWSDNTNWSDQSVLGFTKVLNSGLVSDARFNYRYWHNDAVLANLSECPSPCFGYGLPQLNMIGSANFLTGTQGNNPQHLNRRNFETQETLSWQKGEHRFQFGGNLDIYTNNWFYGTCTAGCMGVYSVETINSVLGSASSTYLNGLPVAVRSSADLLKLPVYFPQPGVTAGFSAGPGFEPGPYHFQDKVRNLRPRIYMQDSWKLRANVTLNYGLSYEVESGLFNSDIPKPRILGPILGPNDLSPTGIDQGSFGPAFGFAWSPGKAGRTVIRGGGGLYWDTIPIFYRLHEATEIGPVGNGRPRMPGTLFLNAFPGIVMQSGQGQFVPLSIGAPLPTATFTNLTLGQFLQIYNQQYPALSALLSPASPQTSGPVTVSALDLVKSGSELMQPRFPLDRSYQTSIGIQRELGHDTVLTIDWVRRQGENVLQGEVDFNHYNEFLAGVQTPAIPQCRPAQLLVPGALCSTGPLQFLMPEGRSVYEGMLLKVNKQLSHHYHFLVSYALQNLNSNASGGLASAIVNLNNYIQSYGPRLPRHNLNISGMVNLPWQVELSLNSSIISRTPAMPLTTNIDLSGTGAVNSGPLPGLGYDCGGISCSKSDLTRVVAAFDETYAGTKAPNGTTIPRYVLPSHYQFGDPTIAQDFRLSKTFVLRDRYHLSVFAEVFNAFNIANLTGYSFNLDTQSSTPATQRYAFGQPTQRASQIFLSGGPRAEQLGARFWF
ncbi:MAG TPA: TonB-dependent receptor [Bryobacteraceae bacterium]|nr:TonB-dependent receptor [Bryobacteraceae bacterium]